MRIGSLAVAILLAVAAACSAIDTVYPVDIVLTTTSDWTDVSLIGANLVVVSYEILEGAEAAGLRVDALATMSVSQSMVGIQRGVLGPGLVIQHQASSRNLTIRLTLA